MNLKTYINELISTEKNTSGKMRKIAAIVMMAAITVIGVSANSGSENKEKRSPLTMKSIPGTDFRMLDTEVTQELYQRVMGINPSFYKAEDNPVDSVCWNDAVVFCNMLSIGLKLTPVYSVNGKTNPLEWNYNPKWGNIDGIVEQNLNANGFRLPTRKEWEYAAKGGQNYKYSGSDNLDEVGWYKENSGNKIHTVAQKKPNDYGLYDMSGNVQEFCWDIKDHGISRYILGGSYDKTDIACWLVNDDHADRIRKNRNYGFRIVVKK